MERFCLRNYLECVWSVVVDELLGVSVERFCWTNYLEFVWSVFVDELLGVSVESFLQYVR